MFFEKRKEEGSGGESDEGGGSVSVYCSSLEKFVRVLCVCVRVCVRARARMCVLVAVGLRCVFMSVCVQFFSVVCVGGWFAFVPGSRVRFSSGLG